MILGEWMMGCALVMYPCHLLPIMLDPPCLLWTDVPNMVNQRADDINSETNTHHDYTPTTICIYIYNYICNIYTDIETCRAWPWQHFTAVGPQCCAVRTCLMCSRRWSGVSSMKISKGSTRTEMEFWDSKHMADMAFTRWKLFITYIYTYIIIHTYQNHGLWEMIWLEFWSTCVEHCWTGWLRVEDFILDLQPHLQALSKGILQESWDKKTASRDISRESHRIPRGMFTFYILYI